MGLKDFVQIVLFCVVLEKTSLRTVFAQSRREITGDPNNFYTTVELACSEGYPIQEHTVLTRDGYILTVHRIPHGKFRPKIPHRRQHYHQIHLKHHPDFDDCVRESWNETSTGIPILFVHGVLMASDGWLLQGPGYDLAYMMVEKGFDVWLANIRGNFYSRKHRSLSPSDPKFWDFSFHENAKYDIPATIDYIQKLTKKEKVGYVGFSMGTTIFFTMTSLLPEYNDKILGFTALAPVGFLKDRNIDSRKRIIFRFIRALVKEFDKRNIQEVLGKSRRFTETAMLYCSKGSELQNFCYELVTVILGFPSKLVLKNKFHLYLTHVPSGSSLKNFKHFDQNLMGNCFKQYDYGPEKNMALYGNSTPPDYPVWNITAPVALYYSLGDFFCSPKDLKELKAMLPNLVADIDVGRKFNHGDFMWSYQARNTLYPKVVNFFKTLGDAYYFGKNRKAQTQRGR